MAHYVILGATGHVGGAVARALLDKGEAVSVVTRDATHARPLERSGADVQVADVRDVGDLSDALASGTRAFLLNPPGDITGDSDADEIETIDAMLAAAARVAPERIVVESTYGAQAGEHIGDLGTLFRLEQGAAALAAPAAIIRGAYYFTNWDASLASARDEGVIRTPYAADFIMPMVSPADLGKVAADLLVQHVPAAGIHHVEGPQHYSPQHAADAFAAALGRPVRVETVPREEWEVMYRDLGFSAVAARSFARMARITVDHLALPDEPIRGTVTLDDHIAELVRRA